MLLLWSLLLQLLLLLLGAPLGCAERAAAAFTPERVLEWQGECPPSPRMRDQIGNVGALGWSRERRMGEAGGGRGQRKQLGLDGGRFSAVLRKPCGWASPAYRLALHRFLLAPHPLPAAGIL